MESSSLGKLLVSLTSRHGIYKDPKDKKKEEKEMLVFQEQTVVRSIELSDPEHSPAVNKYEGSKISGGLGFAQGKRQKAPA